MKKFLLLFTIIFTLTSSLYAKKYALIVGVPSGFAPNSGIELDMKSMEGLFDGYGYKIKILKDPRPKDLRAALKNYQSLSANDNFVFYYTGHGGQMPDRNGDESDGKDEFLALREIPKGASSQGDYSSFFVDDEMYGLLSKIKAKKYVFFDSCNSGTAFKSAGSNAVSKSLGFFKGARVVAYEDTVNENTISSLAFFGAAKDGTSAQATRQGSMFTLAIKDALKHKKGDLNGDGKITFKELETYTRNDIKKLCRNNGSPVFIPELHMEGMKKSENVIDALKRKSRITSESSSSRSALERGFDQLLSNGSMETLSVSSKASYKNGQNITLSINSKNASGYLYVILIDKNEHTLLYPNKYEKTSKVKSGKFNFPRDVSSKFQVEAAPPYGRTVIYTILSPKPLDMYNKCTGNVFNVFGLDSPQSAKTLNLMRGAVVKANKVLLGKTIYDVKR